MLLTVNSHLVVGGPAGFFTLPAQAALEHFVFAHYAPTMEMLVSSIPGFGSSAPDTSYNSGITTTSTVFVHPQIGDDANSGLTPDAPKRSLPVPATGLKGLVAAGSTVQRNGSAGAAITSGVNNFGLSVYDAVVASPSWGQEIFTQPNPFDRAMLGLDVTDVERQTKYWTLDMGSVPTDTTATKGFHLLPGINSGYRNVIRGAVIQNATQFAVESSNGTLRVEDCIIQDIQWTPVSTNYYSGGEALRVNTNSTAKIDAARLFIRRIGGDVAWLHNGTSGHKVVDCSIVHTCDRQLVSLMHADVFQFDSYPGDFLFRRLAIRHRVSPNLLVDGGDGQLIPQGAVVMSTGNTGIDTPGGLIEDVVMLTNRQGFNFEEQSGTRLNRVAGLIVGDDGQGAAVLTIYQHGQHEQSNCAFASIATPAARVATLTGAMVVSTNVQDFGRLDA